MKKVNFIIIAALLATSMFATACNLVDSDDNSFNDTDSNIESKSDIQDIPNANNDSQQIVNTDGYSLYFKNNSYYMKINRKYTPDNSNDDLMLVPPHAHFADVTDLINSVKSGNLNEQQLNALAFYTDDLSELDVGNLDEIIDMNIEQEHVGLDYVMWDGKNIYFRFKNTQGSLGFMDKDNWNNKVDMLRSDIDNYAKEVISSEFDNGGANIYVNNFNGKIYLYTIKTDSKTFVVEKGYYPNNCEDDNSSELPTVPNCIKVFGEENGIYYSFMVNNVDLTDEQLLEFGIKNK